MNLSKMQQHTHFRRSLEALHLEHYNYLKMHSLDCGALKEADFPLETRLSRVSSFDMFCGSL